MGNNNLEAYYGLPADVQFCKNCVISNQRPSSTIEFKNKKSTLKDVIYFNSDGVCDSCSFHTEKHHSIDWDHKERQLEELLAKYRSSDGSYDVLVPGSGGKDSAYAAHVLKYKYKMNPLTVTWAPHLYTNIGWENFQNWMHEGGLDNILYTPNGKLHRQMTRNAFHGLMHPFQPFIIGQKIIGPAMALKFGIKLVMYGENQAEDGNSIIENQSEIMNSNFFALENKFDMRFGGVLMQEYIDEYGFNESDFNAYIPPSPKEIIDAGVTTHYLGYYLKWDPQENYYYATENTGFKANSERTEGSSTKYSGIDDKIDPFHYYTTLIKFGIGRCSYDTATEIRNHQINRDEGVYLVKKYDTEFPSKYFQEFLKYISTSEDEFWKLIDKHRSPHLWKKIGKEWFLRHNVSSDGTDD